jgi:hypothetical protein
VRTAHFIIISGWQRRYVHPRSFAIAGTGRSTSFLISGWQRRYVQPRAFAFGGTGCSTSDVSGRRERET